MRKDQLDTFGAVSLVMFSALLGLNQVVIAVTNEGLQPVFAAGLRSVGAAGLMALWMWFRGISLRPAPGTVPAGLLIGAVFATEFVLLFNALDLTTVSRVSVIFYTMPVWLALAAHVLLPGERLTRLKFAGLILAVIGVAWAILDRPETGGAASLTGDILALLASFSWAGIALCARGTAMKTVRPETQLLWQLTVSAPVLLVLSIWFGPFVRDLAPIHLWGLAFQTVVVASAGFVFWLWLLSIYPAATVAAFSFLGPIFGVLFGAMILGETVGPEIIGAVALVATGLVLVSWPRAQVPQKV